MRLPLAVICLSLFGCKSEQELRYTSVLQSPTTGIALSDDGVDAYAGMMGTTCTINTEFGCPVADVDLPSSEEKVTDQLRGRVLGIAPGGVYLIDNLRQVSEEVLAVARPRSAQLFDGGGVVVLHGDAAGCWVQRDVGERLALPPAACDDGVRVAVDREDGTLFAATSEGLLAARPSGLRHLGLAPDLVAWDSELRQLYVANSGRRRLRALDATGRILWSVDVGGAITSLVTRGSLGEVLVLREGSSMASIERIDGQDGVRLGGSAVPDARAELRSSGDGQRVALVRDDAVYFYAFDIDPNKAQGQRVPPTCIDPLGATTD